MEPSTPLEDLLKENRALKDRIASLERENDALKRAAVVQPPKGLIQLKDVADLIPAIIWYVNLTADVLCLILRLSIQNPKGQTTRMVHVCLQTKRAPYSLEGNRR